MANAKWTPNETQQQFMNILKEYPDGISLKEIEVATGKAFATGSINTLLGKNLVESCGEATYPCELVAEIFGQKVVVGCVNKVWKKYRLVH